MNVFTSWRVTANSKQSKTIAWQEIPMGQTLIRGAVCAAAAALSLLAGAPAGAAGTTFQLRYFELQTVSPWQTSDTLGAESIDPFNNGIPLSGIVHQPLFNGTPNGSPIAGTYISNALSKFGAGTESNGPASDFVGTTYGVGSLQFRSSDAGANNSNLTPAGASTSSLVLQPAVPASTALGLVGRNSGFYASSFWNYSAMQPGESILLVLSGSGAPDYVDRLQVRIGSSYANGTPFINFEQQSRVGSTLARTVLNGTTPSAVYGNLSDVDYFSLELSRAMPTVLNPSPAVQAKVMFYDAAVDSNDELVTLGSYTFAASPQTFQGSGDFQSVFSVVSWNTTNPVPEPATSALMLLGLVGLGGVLRRARSS
jgi:hypothetical protein